MEITAKFDHFNFNVSDLERSIEFYNKTLGLEISHKKEAKDGSFILVYLKDKKSDFLLELTWLKDHPQQYDLGECEFHLCIRVDEDLSSYDNIRIQTDVFDDVKGIKAFIRKITGPNQLEIKNIDIDTERFFTYSYVCIDQEHWNDENDFEKIRNTLLILLGLYIFSAVCSFIQNYIMNTISCKMSYNLRRDISEKMHKLPLSYFETRTHGEILSRITNDVDTLSSNLSQTLSQVVSSIATLIGTLVMMISISGSMTISSILVLP